MNIWKPLMIINHFRTVYSGVYYQLKDTCKAFTPPNMSFTSCIPIPLPYP